MKWLIRLAVRFLRRHGLEVVDPSRISHARGRFRVMEALTLTSGALTNGARYDHARKKIRTYAQDGLFHLEGAPVDV